MIADLKHKGHDLNQEYISSLADDEFEMLLDDVEDAFNLLQAQKRRRTFLKHHHQQ